MFTSYAALGASLILTTSESRQKEKVHTVDYALVIPRFALQELVPLKLLIWVAEEVRLRHQQGQGQGWGSSHLPANSASI